MTLSNYFYPEKVHLSFPKRAFCPSLCLVKSNTPPNDSTYQVGLLNLNMFPTFLGTSTMPCIMGFPFICLGSLFLKEKDVNAKGS